MAAPAIPTQPDFLVQIRQTQHAIRVRLDADLASTGLTTPQFTVLAVLEREGELSASDLAREFVDQRIHVRFIGKSVANR